MTAVDFDDLPGWDQDPVGEALPALKRSCTRLLARSDTKSVAPVETGGTVADWRPACEALTAVPEGADAELREVLSAEFTLLHASRSDGKAGLFTGYYEPELKGAEAPDSVYRWPIYGRPADLVTVRLGRFVPELDGETIVGRIADGRLVPYLTRAEIDDGGLSDRGLELIWLDDSVEAFFLHIQGSGKVVLPDGRSLRVGYAASNGHTFYAIGRALIEAGEVPRDKASAQAIRDWLRANPDRAQELMQRNKRFIFFRRIEGDGPIGGQGVALTAGRSLAVDPAFVPLGTPLWLDTTWPGSNRPLRRLVVAQDVGSAIKGPVRGDLFWGPGEAALEQAGRMKQGGGYYLLLPKVLAERLKSTS